MSEKNLTERLQLQNERIKELEEKIKKLEDKENDGKYLMSLKNKIMEDPTNNKEIENIYSLSDLEVEQIKVKAKQLALVAYETGDYEIYKNYSLIAKENEQQLIEVTEEYKKELEEVIPSQYLNLENLDPKELEELSKGKEKTDLNKAEKEKEQEDTVNKMQEDTGLELVSLVKIEDENFSKEVVGKETGYADQYMGITKDGTICLLGLRPDNKFELNPDFYGARTARPDEQPGRCGDSSVDMVVPRKDGNTSGLGIDINFGNISLTNRNTNEPIETSNYKPSEVDIEKYRLEEEKVSKKELEKKIAIEERKKEEQARAEEEEEEENGWPGERRKY